MEQQDISEDRLELLIKKVRYMRDLKRHEYRDIESALIELQERREFEKGAPFMSKVGDWLLGFILVGIVCYGVWVLWLAK